MIYNNNINHMYSFNASLSKWSFSELLSLSKSEKQL